MFPWKEVEQHYSHIAGWGCQNAETLYHIKSMVIGNWINKSVEIIFVAHKWPPRLQNSPFSAKFVEFWKQILMPITKRRESKLPNILWPKALMFWNVEVWMTC